MPRIYKKHLDLGIQRYWMKYLFPEFKYFKAKLRNYWIGYLKPTDVSPSYKVRIDILKNKPPKINILEPIIEHDKHIYPDGSLCLYYPSDPIDLKWTRDSIIAKTIVPWTAAWLYFYEYWLETDIWFNEEAPHAEPKRNS